MGRKFKTVVALLMSLALAVPTAVSAADDAVEKASAVITSGTATMQASVYDDYSSEFRANKAGVLDPSSVAVTLTAGEKSVSKEAGVNVDMTIKLSQFLGGLSKLSQTNINVNVEGADFDYVLTGANTSDEWVVEGSTDKEAVHAAIDAARPYVTVDENSIGTEVTLAAGTVITFYNKSLVVKNTVTLDPADMDSVASAIKDNVEVKEVEATNDAYIYVPAGSTYVTVKNHGVSIEHDATVTVNGLKNAGNIADDIDYLVETVEDENASKADIALVARDLVKHVVDSMVNANVNVVVDFVDHSYVESVTKEATCTEAGEKTFACECGLSYTEEIPALGHIDENEDLICDRCGAVLGEIEEPVHADKVEVNISSEAANGTGSVHFGVDADYNAHFTADKGQKVNPNNALVELIMRDVASLGVNGEKSHSWNVGTGSSNYGDVNLDTALRGLKNYNWTNVNGSVTCLETEAKAVFSYHVENESTDAEWVINATAKGAEDAWALIANHIELPEAEADSKAVVLAGTYIQIGAEKLVFDEDVVLNDANALRALEAAIRTAGHLEDAEGTDIVVYLPAGSLVAVDASAAKLTGDATITLSGLALEKVLSDAREVKTIDDCMLLVLDVFNEVLTQANEKDLTLDIVLCEAEETPVVPDHEHSYVLVEEKDATCTEDGYKKYACECGDEYTEVIEATGHTWGEWEVTKEATCTDEGEMTRTCSVCGATETKSIAIDEDAHYDGCPHDKNETPTTPDDDDKTPTTPDKDDETTTTPEVEDNTSDDVAANTGDNSAVSFYVLLCVAAVAAVLVFKKRRMA